MFHLHICQRLSLSNFITICIGVTTTECSIFHYKCNIIIIIDYSELEDEFLDEKGDEWFPLGKSFQNHVKLYMRCVYIAM